VNWAFSDESERGNLMLFGLLTASTAEVVRARKELRTLLMPGQRRVHTAKESPRRRRLLLDAVGGLEVVAIVFRLRRPAGMHRIAARELLLIAACAVLEPKAITNWVLDDEEPVQAMRDRRAIDRAIGDRTDFSYDHRPSHDEPLLWAVDAIVWAVGAGGPMFDRVQHLVEFVEIGP
jgi:hypothetical protein